MPKFRKKPVVIEAWQFTDETKERVLHECQVVQMNATHAWDADGKPCLRIPTLEGEMTCSLGDWMIKGVKNELYPCKPDIFEATYEAVSE
jgi:hypothetical protein